LYDFASTLPELEAPAVRHSGPRILSPPALSPLRI
jgi:hypothetical protein